MTLASVASHARTSAELFSEVVRIAIATGLFGECFGKFSELFGEPEEGRGDAAGGIGGVVAFTDEVLELSNGHRGDGGIDFSHTWDGSSHWRQ